MQAGEYKKIEYEVDLSVETMPKDWSVVAWAPNEVYVYPEDPSRVSDTFEVVGGTGRENFVRPVLPLATHDSSAFTQWASTEGVGTWTIMNTQYDTAVTGFGFWVQWQNPLSYTPLKVSWQV